VLVHTVAVTSIHTSHGSCPQRKRLATYGVLKVFYHKSVSTLKSGFATDVTEYVVR